MKYKDEIKAVRAKFVAAYAFFESARPGLRAGIHCGVLFIHDADGFWTCYRAAREFDDDWIIEAPDDGDQVGTDLLVQVGLLQPEVREAESKARQQSNHDSRLAAAKQELEEAGYVVKRGPIEQRTEP